MTSNLDFPEMKPRYLPIGSRVVTTIGEGLVESPVKLGYHRIYIDKPSNVKIGIYDITDESLLRIIEYGHTIN